MKYITSTLIIVTTVFLALAANSSTKINASFNCEKASQPIEHAICADSELADLDKKMAVTYKNKKSSSPANEINTLKQEQKIWLKSRIKSCAISKANYKSPQVLSCLKNSYTNRISDINKDNEYKTSFYKQSLHKTKFTLNDREKWKKLVKWPNSCEFDDLQHMSNAGLKFYKLNENNILLRVTCSVYAYQSEYKLYNLNISTKTVKATALNIPQLKAKNNKWAIYKSNNMTGHLQHNIKNNTLLRIHKYSGAGQCGDSSRYSITFKNQTPVLNITKAWGNDDCNKSMGEDDWPEIKLFK